MNGLLIAAGVVVAVGIVSAMFSDSSSQSSTPAPQNQPQSSRRVINTKKSSSKKTANTQKSSSKKSVNTQKSSSKKAANTQTSSSKKAANTQTSSSKKTAASGGRTFSVINPEGEIYSINTADKNSLFYGRAWFKILEANEKGECFRGRAVKKSVGRNDNTLSGYFIDIEGVQAFLPVSKAAWFYNPEHDAVGKSIALMIEDIFTNGPKAGTLVVNAYKPLKHILTAQSREAFTTNAEPWMLAMDCDSESLIFPHFGNKVVRVPLHDAAALAKRKGIGSNSSNLTGRFWRVKIHKWAAGGVCTAQPVDVMTD